MRVALLVVSLSACSLSMAVLPTTLALAQAVPGQQSQEHPLPANPAPASPFGTHEKLAQQSFVTRADVDAELTPEERCDREANRQNSRFQSGPVGEAFRMYVSQMGKITQANWGPLMPKEVDKPFYKAGEVKVCFAILPSGQLEPKSVLLRGSSGDDALDRAAMGAIQTSVYPRLPEEFMGSRFVIQVCFEYNKDRRPNPVKNMAKPPNPFGPVAVTVGYTSKL